MPQRIHLAAGFVAFGTIAVFFVSTCLVELFGTAEAIAAVKFRIVAPGLFVLIPALMATGGSGFFLSRNRGGRLVAAKKKRMPFIVANGVLILLPAAFFLDSRAAVGDFDSVFYAVQAAELLAGAINLTLMGLNIRDGLKMSGRFRRAN